MAEKHTPIEFFIARAHGQIRPFELRFVLRVGGGEATDVTFHEFPETVEKFLSPRLRAILYSDVGPSTLPRIFSHGIEVHGSGQEEVRHLSAPTDIRDRRIHELEQEREKLKLENQLLQSRVAQERRATARETRQHDQRLIEFNKLQQHNESLLNCSKRQLQAIDATTALLLGQQNAQLRMSERYEGVVEHVHGDNVTVVFEIDDDVVEHKYDRNQFIDGQLPQEGDRFTVYVHVVHGSVATEDEPALDIDESDEHDDQRSRITGPIEF